MATRINSAQILDESVKRSDLNSTTPGSAVIKKIIQGTNVTISSTGVDSGTGDVTVSVTSFPWDSITGRPTTVSGYGLTDVYTKTEINSGLGFGGTYSTANLGPLNTNFLLSGTPKPMFGDDDFSTGMNGVGTYDTGGKGAVTITRKADPLAPNQSKYVLEIVKNDNTASPGLGGFVQSYVMKPNEVIIQRFVAKIPVGYALSSASDATGDGATDYWATSTAGTGKWETYVRVRYAGQTGTFSSTGHVYLIGPEGAVTWYLASANIFTPQVPGTTRISDYQVKDVSWGKLTGVPDLVKSIGNNTDLSVRTPSGFYEHPSATKALGWPEDANAWYHAIVSTNSNGANYHSLQLAAPFNNQKLFFRVTADSGARTWQEIYHTGNLSPARTNQPNTFTSSNQFNGEVGFSGKIRVGTANGGGNMIDIANSGNLADLDGYSLAMRFNGGVNIHSGTTVNNPVHRFSSGGSAWHSSNLSVGSPNRREDRVISVVSGYSNKAGLKAHGSEKGAGYLYVGKSDVYGGGVYYNGDGNPAFASSGEVTNSIVFYRTDAGSNIPVFYYPYNNNNVYFVGNTSSLIATGRQGLYTDTGYSAYTSYLRNTAGHIAVQMTDSWLRLNENLQFSSGIYAGTGVLRTDGNFQIGDGGSRANFTTNAAELKTNLFLLNGKDLIFKADDTGDIIFMDSAGTERARIWSTGASINFSSSTGGTSPNFSITTAGAYVNGSYVWHAGNFDPNNIVRNNVSTSWYGHQVRISKDVVISSSSGWNEQANMVIESISGSSYPAIGWHRPGENQMTLFFNDRLYVTQDGTNHHKLWHSGDFNPWRMTDKVEIVKSTGTDTHDKYTRANLLLITDDGSTPTIGFLRNGHDAASISYGNGHNFYVVYDHPYKIWHAGNFSPDSYYTKDQVNGKSTLRFADTRTVDTPPTDYDHNLVTEFKYRSVVGAPGTDTYGALVTLAPWMDGSGGSATQIFASSDGIFTRNANLDSSWWCGWEEIVVSNRHLDASNGEKQIGFKFPGANTFYYGNTSDTRAVGLYDSEMGHIWRWDKSTNEFNIYKVVRSHSGIASGGSYALWSTSGWGVGVGFEGSHGMYFSTKGSSHSAYIGKTIDNRLRVMGMAGDIGTNNPPLPAFSVDVSNGYTFTYGNANVGGSMFIAANHTGSVEATPAVNLAMGDNDTGLNWHGDGHIGIWSNNVHIGGWSYNGIYANPGRYFESNSYGLSNAPGGVLQNGMFAGGADAAGFDRNNVEIMSWYGIGFRSSLDNTTRIYMNPRDGLIATTGQINAQHGFYQSASRALKTDIRDPEFSGLEIIMSTAVKTFKYISDETSEERVGFIAEDTPKELSGPGKDKFRTTDTVAVLIKAVQELTDRVMNLEARLNQGSTGEVY